jgi:hypothetical protein
VAQVIENLPSLETLSSKPSTTKKKEKKERPLLLIL